MGSGVDPRPDMGSLRLGGGRDAPNCLCLGLGREFYRQTDVTVKLGFAIRVLPLPSPLDGDCLHLTSAYFERKWGEVPTSSDSR